MPQCLRTCARRSRSFPRPHFISPVVVRGNLKPTHSKNIRLLSNIAGHSSLKIKKQFQQSLTTRAPQPRDNVPRLCRPKRQVRPISSIHTFRDTGQNFGPLVQYQVHEPQGAFALGGVCVPVGGACVALECACACSWVPFTFMTYRHGEWKLGRKRHLGTDRSVCGRIDTGA